MNKQERITLLKKVGQCYGETLKCEWLTPNGDEWMPTSLEVDGDFIKEVERGTIRNTLPPDYPKTNFLEEIHRLKSNFEHLISICDKTTSGNVSHNIATIKGICKRNVEYVDKYFRQ